jgi:hypothetical protein
MWRGDLERAKAVLVDAKALRERFHGRGSALLIDMNLGAVLRERGEYAAALALLEPVATEMRALASEARDGNTDAVLAENHLAQLWLLLGRSDRALALLAGDDTSVDVRFRGRRVALKLRIAHWQRRPDPALSAALRGLIEQQSSAFNRAWLQLDLVSSLAPAQARDELSRLMDDAAVAERPGLAMHVALRLAQVSVALGQATLALGLVEPVLAALATTTPFDIVMSEVWSIAGLVFGAAGQAERAAEAARQGRQWLEDTARTAVPEALRADFLRAHRGLARP